MDNNSTIIIQQVISLQAQALRHFGATCDTQVLINAACLLQESLMIFTLGVGKSAHIAGKIADTLTSIGSPAIFLSAEQLLHGSLNLLNFEGACVLIVSKSGETSELLDIFPPTCYTSVKKILISSSENSSLAQIADVVISYGDVEECCGLNVVPTTSTTLSLVIGDILAAMLMVPNGFTCEKFSETHPGGSLGKTLRRSLEQKRETTLYERNHQQKSRGDFINT